MFKEGALFIVIERLLKLGCTFRCAALLCVGVGKECALVVDTIDIGFAPTHHTVVTSADIPHTNIVFPYDRDVGLGSGQPAAKQDG
jgi:hypothetical protein